MTINERPGGKKFKELKIDNQRENAFYNRCNFLRDAGN